MSGDSRKVRLEEIKDQDRLRGRNDQSQSSSSNTAEDRLNERMRFLRATSKSPDQQVGTSTSHMHPESSTTETPEKTDKVKGNEEPLYKPREAPYKDMSDVIRLKAEDIKRIKGIYPRLKDQKDIKLVDTAIGMLNSLYKEIKETGTAIEAGEDETSKCRKALEEAYTESKKITASKVKLENNKYELKNQYNKINSDIKEKIDKNRLLEKNLSKKQEEHNLFENKDERIRILEENIQDNTTKIGNISHEIKQRRNNQSRLNKLNTERIRINEENKKHRDSINDIIQKTSSSNIKSIEQEIESIKQNIESTKGIIHSLDIKRESISESIATETEAHSKLLKESKALKNEIKKQEAIKEKYDKLAQRCLKANDKFEEIRKSIVRLDYEIRKST